MTIYWLPRYAVSSHFLQYRACSHLRKGKEKKKKIKKIGVSSPQRCNSIQFYSTSRTTATEAEGARAGPSGRARFQGLWVGDGVPDFLLLPNEGRIDPASRQHLVLWQRAGLSGLSLAPQAGTAHRRRDRGVREGSRSAGIRCVPLSLFCCPSRLCLKPALLLRYWPGRWAVCCGKSFFNSYTKWKCKAHVIDGGWFCKIRI